MPTCPFGHSGTPALRLLFDENKNLRSAGVVSF